MRSSAIEKMPEAPPVSAYGGRDELAAANAARARRRAEAAAALGPVILDRRATGESWKAIARDIGVPVRTAQSYAHAARSAGKCAQGRGPAHIGAGRSRAHGPSLLSLERYRSGARGA